MNTGKNWTSSPVFQDSRLFLICRTLLSGPFCKTLSGEVGLLNKDYYLLFQNISIPQRTLPYYGTGPNYGNWIFQPFSSIFPKYLRSNFSSGRPNNIKSKTETRTTREHLVFFILKETLICLNREQDRRVCWEGMYCSLDSF